MDFGYDVRTEEFRKRLLAFMDECVYPAEPVFAAQVRDNAEAGRAWERPAIVGFTTAFNQTLASLALAEQLRAQLGRASCRERV